MTIAARYPETVATPVSGLRTQEIYTLCGTAVVSERGTRTLTGVEAQGMTACPCAQELVSGRSRERLAADGFTDDEIERVLEAVPVATHNQRGIGSLHLGRPEGVELDVDARDLLHIVEQSMSSEIYELMKRSDEAAVVEKAHRNPRFVEDCVREMIRRVAEAYPQLATAASCSPARRTWRRSTATRWSPSAPACSPRSSPSSRAASTRRHHMTEREWLEAPCSP